MTSAATGIATGVTSSNDPARLTRQAVMATGTTSAATANPVTRGADRTPMRPTARIARNTHITKAAARANGSSARNSAPRTPKDAQNRGAGVASGSRTSGMASQQAAKAAAMA